MVWPWHDFFIACSKAFSFVTSFSPTFCDMEGIHHTSSVFSSWQVTSSGLPHLPRISTSLHGIRSLFLKDTVGTCFIYFCILYVYVFVLILHGSKCNILVIFQGDVQVDYGLILSKTQSLTRANVSGYNQETRNLSRANGTDSQSYLCTRISAEDVRDEQRDHCDPLLPSPAHTTPFREVWL